jgi:hypothetical protein
MFIPDPESKFFHPGFRIPDPRTQISDPRSKRFLDPGSGELHQRIEVFLTQKIVSKLSEI